MPMVVYLYVDWRKSGAREGWQEPAALAHDYIISNLQSNQPDFEYFTVFDAPVRTKKRRTAITGAAQDATFTASR